MKIMKIKLTVAVTDDMIPVAVAAALNALTAFSPKIYGVEAEGGPASEAAPAAKPVEAPAAKIPELPKVPQQAPGTTVVKRGPEGERIEIRK